MLKKSNIYYYLECWFSQSQIKTCTILICDCGCENISFDTHSATVINLSHYTGCRQLYHSPGQCTALASAADLCTAQHRARATYCKTFSDIVADSSTYPYHLPNSWLCVWLYCLLYSIGAHSVRCIPILGLCVLNSDTKAKICFPGKIFKSIFGLKNLENQKKFWSNFRAFW